MATYTTFFLASADELATGFPSWKAPLPVPVERSMRNPFTGKTTTIMTSEPEWTDEAEPIVPPQKTVVAIEGDYGDYLESRLPAFVRARAHWATKGLTELELGPLLMAAGLP